MSPEARARDLDERFESRLLPFFVRRTREVDGLLPELYLHGLAEGDMGMIAIPLPVRSAVRFRMKRDRMAPAVKAEVELS